MLEPLERAMLARAWFPVARLNDVSGGPVSAAILDVDLAVFGHEDGPRVVGACCPHRGANLSLGRLVDGDIECPYHGWRFAPDDGRCTMVPSLPTDSPVARASIATYPAVAACGLVWSCLEEPFLPFAGFPELAEGEWHFAYGEPHDVHCGIRQLTENFRDISHFPFVHSATLGPNVRRQVDSYRIERRDREVAWQVVADLGGAPYQTDRSQGSALANGQTMNYSAVLPSVARIFNRGADGGKRYLVQIAVPLGADGEWCRQFYFLAVDDQTLAAGASLEELFAFEERVFAEDRPIVESQRPREAPLDPRVQAHTRADRYSIAYREAYKDALNDFAAKSSEGSAGGTGGLGSTQSEWQPSA